MLKKCLIILLLIPINSIANEVCKPKLIELKVVKSDAYPFENKLADDLSFFTSIPDQLITVGKSTSLEYNPAGKSITYVKFDKKISDYHPNTLFLKAFGYEEDEPIDEETLIETRSTWGISCENNISEIKTTKQGYRIVLIDKNKDIKEYHVFIIATNNPQVFLLKFKNFLKSQIKEILSTVKEDE